MAMYDSSCASCVSSTTGPMCVALSSASPTLSFFIRSIIAATKRSWMPSVTISRDEAVQRCPVPKNAPLIAHSTATSRLASSTTTSGFLPPISSWNFFMPATHAAATFCPVATDPVKVTASMPAWLRIACPTTAPRPMTRWKIPAGNPARAMICASADAVPGTAHALAQIIARAGLPAGIFNLVMGRGAVVGQAILNHAGIDAVTFTGSVATGQKVAAACVAGMKKFQLEMGGKNPLVVVDDANLDVAVECAINGAFFGTGQRCTASSRLIVTEGIHDRFVAAMIERMKKLNVGDALDSATHIGPVVDETQLAQDESYIAIGRDEGATLAYGGERLTRGTPGYYLAPALFTGVAPSMRIAREEIFGPVAAVMRVRDYDAALAAANDTPFGLASGICTTSLKHATHFKRNAEAGMVMVNLPTAGVDYHVPFGGRKSSSYGAREQGRYAAEFYTVVKTAYTMA